MEFNLSGNALKTFARSVTCLARIGNELVIQASPSQLAFYTLNASRSAYQAITFEPGFFDTYAISGNQVQCSVLLKAVCSVLRTSIASVDHLRVQLPDTYALKIQWSLECFNGIKKTYCISCNVEPDIQHLSLDRRQFPSDLVVRPRDLNRLLSNFQSSLQEITVIATEPTSLPSEAAIEIEGKAVELRSYIDPTKDNDALLHTQLWIDPMEEFVHYSHSGDPVDITFGVRELKAFLSFCEGCEVDIHLFFEKAGEPILLAPKFGLDDGSGTNFDATLVLATMLVSQLHAGSRSQPPQEATTGQGESDHRAGSQPQQDGPGANVSGHPSDHTRIWSELSGSAPRSGNGAEGQVQGQSNLSSSEQMEIQRISNVQISKAGYAQGYNLVDRARDHSVGRDLGREHQERSDINGPAVSQHHPSNWVDEEDEDDDNDDGDDNELCVQSTPPYYEEH
ncbi:cell cycle checkpoint control protein RAD9A isoform X1 [Cucurbita moschata]|uniref:Cell cycle checkpoint control protein RAD9A isoform X1 n=1 Tax=Cucurbita moschata TaxID=3662 RepID=A0A6J1FGA2_CUCMO|nr:cell cycle checkpoint control protein RAD9A isoform X1 [Cucurbita moschata]XP_022937529.1 cell cycle checkpoint control protein RAD9A isoform X1 [Cucurbita moschata]XP_022937530.1 cell cycle checkpoint control protein RAD9A isoform X1 [Cucurbita moschata]XP_022937531.1 cell cycle checkpoint control protein RAD9A isoform X1 [Cucurbita moschata]XP_022937532.1 cell cycle checkpoint control protein RAD9A isoform X1 [Cucurbita moschata]XP_022937533.1 cell cycle checkpoint control protein RAD9A i